MKVSELRKILEGSRAVRYPNKEGYDEDVVVRLKDPSIGPVAMCNVKSAWFGFDWESGKFLLMTEEPVTRKTEKQEVWDIAFDFLYSMSQRKTPKGNPTSDAKIAQAIMERAKIIIRK